MIIDAELSAKNSVIEISAWPPLFDRVIILKFRFSRYYDTQSLKYQILNDPHYWHSEYTDINTGELLACRFERHSN